MLSICSFHALLYISISLCVFVNYIYIAALSLSVRKFIVNLSSNWLISHTVYFFHILLIFNINVIKIVRYFFPLGMIFSLNNNQFSVFFPVNARSPIIYITVCIVISLVLLFTNPFKFVIFVINKISVFVNK